MAPLYLPFVGGLVLLGLRAVVNFAIMLQQAVGLLSEKGQQEEAAECGASGRHILLRSLCHSGTWLRLVI